MIRFTVHQIADHRWPSNIRPTVVRPGGESLGAEDCASTDRHTGRSSCPCRGGSRVRTSCGSPAVQNLALQGSLAEAEPEARQVPLQLRKERNETMGLSRQEMAGEGAQADRGVVASGDGHRRMEVHPSSRGCMELEYRQRLLRGASDGLDLPVVVRPRVCETMGHRRQLASLGAAERCSQSQGLRPRVRTLAKHGSRLRADLSQLIEGS